MSSDAPPEEIPAVRAALLAAAHRYRAVGRWAHGWARGKLLRDPAYPAALRELPSTGTLVDIGCGEGYMIAAALEFAPALRAIGIDHDPRRLRVATRAFAGDRRVTLQSADASDIALPTADAIVMIDVLHYIEPRAQDALLDAACAAVRSGGVLIVRDVEPDRGWRFATTALAERLARLVGRHRGRGLHFRSLECAAERAGAAGLRVRMDDCAGGTPFANRLMIANSPTTPE